MLSNAVTNSQIDTVFEALSNAKRRGIVYTLSFRPATVSQLAAEHDLTLAAIHRHVRVLEEAGLVQRRKVGRVNFVAIARGNMRLAQQWLGQFHLEWGDDRESLENYIQSLTTQPNNKE